MPVLLFKLNQVPLDEAEEVRALLSEQELPFYETPQGFWGFSLGGLWLADDQLHLQAQAEEAIEKYQLQRRELAQAEYRPQSLWAAVVEKPLRLVLLLAVLFILYVSLSPFVGSLTG